MKRIFTILFFLLITFTIHAQVWSPLNGPFGAYSYGIGVNPVGGAIYHSVLPGTIYRSTDQGVTWTKVYDGGTGQFFYEMEFDANGRIYIAGGSLLISDNGLDWTSKPLPSPANLIKRAPNGSLYIYTYVNSKIQRSVNEGDSWEVVEMDGLAPAVSATGLAIQDDGTVLVADYGNGIWKSTTGDSESFTLSNAGLPAGFEVSELILDETGKPIVLANSNFYYLGDGINWTATTIPLTASADGEFFKNPAGNVFCANNNEILAFDSGTQEWAEITVNYPPYFAVPFLCSPAQDVLVMGSYGGPVSRSVNNGQDWTDASAGLINPDFRDIIVTSADRVLVGGNAGIYGSTDNGANFERVGDIAANDLFEGVDGTIYAAGSPFGKSSDGGQSFTKIFTAPILYSIDAEGPRLYGASQNSIWYSDNNGDDWTALSLPDMPSGFFSATNHGTLNNTKVFRAAGGYLYWLVMVNGGANAALFKIDPADGSATEITIPDVVIGPNALEEYEGAIYTVTFAPDQVHFSEDGGSQWQSKPIPTAYAFKITDEGVWFCGGINNLHYSTDEGETWTDITYEGDNTGLNMMNVDITPSGRVFFLSRLDLPMSATLIPSNLTFSAITPTSFSGSFTPAPLAPDGYLVLMSANVPPDIDPVDGTTYAQNTILGSISGNDVYAVYSGNGTFFNIADITPGEALYFKVFPFTGSGTNINYYTGDPLTNHIITPPASPVPPDLFHVSSFGLDWMYSTDSYIDENGFYYLTGAYFDGNGNGANDFDPAPGDDNKETLPSYGGPSPPRIDCFIAKYSNTGDLMWAKGIGGAGDDASKDIKVDGAGNVYVCGNFDGATIDLDPGAGVFELSNPAGGYDGFVVKLDADGVFQSGYGVSDIGYDILNSIAIEAPDNIYITGQKSGNLIFEKLNTSASSATVDFAKALPNGEGREILYNSNTNNITVIASVWQNGFFDYPLNAVEYMGIGLSDIIVAHYSTADGSFSGTGKIFGGSGEDYIEDAIADNGDIIITGSFEEVIDFGSGISTSSKGQKDILIARFDNSLTPLWANGIGGPGGDSGMAIGRNTNGHIFITGDFTQIVDFDPGAGTANKAATGRDGFILQLTSLGEFSKAISLGNVDSFGGDNVAGVAVDSNDDIIVATNFGQFGIVDVDPTGEVYTFPTSSGFVKYTEIVSLANQPEGPAGPLLFSQTATSFTGSFEGPTSGTAEGYLVLMRENAVPQNVPANSVVYPAGTFHNDAVAIYSGPERTFTVNNANPTVTYYFAIYSYNGSSGSIHYNTNTLTGAYTLEPTVQASNIVIQERKTNEVTFTFTPGNGQFQLVVFKENSDVDAVPDDFSVGYSGGLTNSFGDGSKFGTDNEVVVIGAGSPGFTVPGLNPGTFYSIAIFDFNDPLATAGGSTSIRANYITGNAEYNPTNFYTLALEPAEHPDTFTAEQGVETITLTFESLNSLGDADGYVILRRTGSTGPSVTGIVDGTINFSDPSLTDSLTTITDGTQTNYTDSELTPGTTYRYLIIPYNIGSDALETRNYKIDSPVEASAIPSADETDPVLDNILITRPQAGGAVITARFSDASGIDGVTISYRSVSSGANFNVQPMISSGQDWTYNISLSELGEIGAEFTLTATDGAENDLTTEKYFVPVIVSGDGMTIPYNSFGDKVTNYRIVAVPLVLTQNPNNVNSVFADDLDAQDNKKWRVARYEGGTTTQNYTGDVDPGKGYWLIVRENPGKVIDSGPGTTVEATADTPFSVTVVAGWNQIGNPYNFDIDWDELRSANPGRNLSQNFKRYTSDGFDEGNDEIKKMEGVFINAGTQGPLVFPVVKPAGGRKSKNTKNTNPIDGSDWEVYLNIEQGELKNLISGVGMHPEASIENDIYDGLSMPRFNDYLEINHTKSIHGFAYSKDIVPTTNSFVWDFSVETSINDEQLITIFWDNSYFGENEKQLVLWDVSQQKTVDMRLHNRYQFHKKTSGQFRVIFGDEDFVKEKTRVNTLVFHNIAPNPVQEESIISFSLPQTERVVIELTDITGRKTETVFEGVLGEGYHEVTYKNNSNTRTGVYIAQIKTGTARAQKRMILKN